MSLTVLMVFAVQAFTKIPIAMYSASESEVAFSKTELLKKPMTELDWSGVRAVEGDGFENH